MSTMELNVFLKASRNIQKNLELVYAKASTPAFIESIHILSEFDRELKKLMETGRIKAPVVLVAGKKNAGKSHLCSILTKNTGLILPYGMGEENKTLCCKWIGSQHLLNGFGDKGDDLRLVSPRSLLGSDSCDYVLVDTPGMDDGDGVAASNALQANCVSGHLILVMDYLTFKDSKQDRILQHARGKSILPIVFDQHHTARTSDERNGQRKAILQYLERYLGTENPTLDPVFLPSMDDLSAEELEMLKNGVSSLVAQRPPDPLVLANNLFTKTKVLLRENLKELFGRAVEVDKSIQYQKIKGLENIAGSILGNERQLSAALRLHLLRTVAMECPLGFFPFRSFLGSLGLAAGAWDRIFFAMTRSVPSIVGLAVQIGRNVHTSLKNRSLNMDGLTKHAESLLHVEMSQPLHQLTLMLPGERDDTKPTESFKVVGIEHLTETLEGLMNMGSRMPVWQKVFLNLMGVASLVTWITLISGPVIALYREFLTAWGQAAYTQGAWKLFPVPSAGMLSSTLIFAYAPVVLMAMITLSLLVTQRRIRRIAFGIRGDYHEEVKKAIDSNILRVECGNPVINAALDLVHDLHQN